MAAYRFWVKVFALSFALGVVSGVTMSFQFGTNWPGFMQTVGNIAGPLLAYEVLTAFFLEATFLSIMLFGTERVSNRVHTLATVLVAAGTTFSAFWILALNSWMHTPAGFEMRDGVAHATDWWAVIFNPSMPYRMTHMLIASGLTAAFLIAGVSAYRWLRATASADVLAAMRTGTYLAAVLIPVQILVGDLHGLNSLEHQPAKVAAMEGLWKTERGAAAVLFGIPDEKERRTHFEIAIPKLASLYLVHSWDGEVQGPGRVRRSIRRWRRSSSRSALMVGHRRPDAAGLVDDRTAAVPPRRAGVVARPRAGRDDVLRLGRGARRLVHDRDRTPAVARRRAS